MLLAIAFLNLVVLPILDYHWALHAFSAQTTSLRNCPLFHALLPTSLKVLGLLTNKHILLCMGWILAISQSRSAPLPSFIGHRTAWIMQFKQTYMPLNQFKCFVITVSVHLALECTHILYQFSLTKGCHQIQRFLKFSIESQTVDLAAIAKINFSPKGHSLISLKNSLFKYRSD